MEHACGINGRVGPPATAHACCRQVDCMACLHSDGISDERHRDCGEFRKAMLSWFATCSRVCERLLVSFRGSMVSQAIWSQTIVTIASSCARRACAFARAGALVRLIACVPAWVIVTCTELAFAAG